MVFAVNVFVPILLIIILSKTNLALKYTNSKHMCISAVGWRLTLAFSCNKTPHLWCVYGVPIAWNKNFSKILLLENFPTYVGFHFFLKQAMYGLLSGPSSGNAWWLCCHLHVAGIYSTPLFLHRYKLYSFGVNYPIYYCCMFKILFSCIALQPRFSQPLPPNSHFPQSHPTLVTLRKKSRPPRDDKQMLHSKLW